LRNPPVKHTVHRHTRNGRPVQSYKRGSGFLVNKYTKKLIPLRSKPLPYDPHPHTPSGRPTDNLCKIAKDQILVWEGKEGSMRIVIGHYRPRMKYNSCGDCGQLFDVGEEIVMAQDYFPFRGYFPTYSAYHQHHFPFNLSNLIQAEEDIEKYMETPYKVPNIFREGEFIEETKDIYRLEDDVHRGMFKK